MHEAPNMNYTPNAILIHFEIDPHENIKSKTTKCFSKSSLASSQLQISKQVQEPQLILVHRIVGSSFWHPLTEKLKDLVDHVGIITGLKILLMPVQALSLKFYANIST